MLVYHHSLIAFHSYLVLLENQSYPPVHLVSLIFITVMPWFYLRFLTV